MSSSWNNLGTHEEGHIGIRDYYVGLQLGVRELSADEWDPVDSPFTGGVDFLAIGPNRWFHWNLAAYLSEDDATVFDTTGATAVESDLWEIDVGITKRFAIAKILQPYLGAGVAVIHGKGILATTTGFVDGSDTTFGGYGRAGIALEVTKSGGFVGIDARYVAGTSLSLAGFETDADGLVGTISFGFSW